MYVDVNNWDVVRAGDRVRWEDSSSDIFWGIVEEKKKDKNNFIELKLRVGTGIGYFFNHEGEVFLVGKECGGVHSGLLSVMFSQKESIA